MKKNNMNKTKLHCMTRPLEKTKKTEIRNKNFLCILNKLFQLFCELKKFV